MRCSAACCLSKPRPCLAFEIAAWWLPVREVSGDYYDYLKTDPDRLVVVIADVSDKGMPAALLMALTRSTVRLPYWRAQPGCGHRQRQSPAGRRRGQRHVRHAVLRRDRVGWRCNLCQCRTQPAAPGRRRRYHRTAPLRRRPGLVEDATYSQRQVRLEPGDFIVFYTDGVTDAMDPARAEFGKERLLALIRAQRQTTAPGRGPPAWPPRYKRSPQPRPQIADDITRAIVRRTLDS